MSDNILKEKLAKIGWTHKYDLYRKYFESVSHKTDAVASATASVIVVSWKYNDMILNCVKLLKEQLTEDVELIFVNNGSSDPQINAIAELADTYLKLNANTGAYLARNMGAVFASNTSILLFIDDDCIPDKNLIAAHIAYHEKYDIIACRGRVFPINENSIVNPAYDLGDTAFPMNSDIEGNSSYRTNVFYEVDGWDDEITFGGGGRVMAIRIFEKYPVYTLQIYAPEPVILHDFYKSYEHAKEKREKQEKSRERLLALHPDFFQISWNFTTHKDDELVLKNSTASQSPIPNSKVPIPNSPATPISNPDHRAPNRLKVLCVLHDFPPYSHAGIQNNALRNTVRFNNKFSDIQIDIFHPVAIDGPNVYSVRATKHQGLNVFILYKPKNEGFTLEMIKNEEAALAFAQFLCENHYDIIHFHSFGQLSASLADVVRIMKIKSLFTIHDSWFLCYGWFRIYPDLTECPGPYNARKCAMCQLRILNIEPTQERVDFLTEFMAFRLVELSNVYQAFDKVYAVSQYIADIHNKYIRKDVQVSYYGFPSLDIEKKYDLSDKITFGFIGGVSANKGIHILIKAFKQLPHKNIQLKLYGAIKHQPYYEYLHTLSQNDDRIEFMGAYSPDNLQHIMPQIDMIIIPSITETYGTVAIEAFQYKIPVIATNACAFPEIVKDGVNGLLFEQCNPDDLLKKLQYIIENKDLIPTLSKNITLPRTEDDYDKWWHKEYKEMANATF